MGLGVAVGKKRVPATSPLSFTPWAKPGVIARTWYLRAAWPLRALAQNARDGCYVRQCFHLISNFKWASDSVLVILPHGLRIRGESLRQPEFNVLRGKLIGGRVQSEFKRQVLGEL
jgi:hypothetical protein